MPDHKPCLPSPPVGPSQTALSPTTGQDTAGSPSPEPTAIEKALLLLDALGTGRRAEPLSGLASRTGMPKSTVCRILKLMETSGFVGRDGPRYCLGPRVLELGRLADICAHSDVRTAGLGILERLYEEVRMTVHLGVLTDSGVLILEKITAPGGSRIPTRAGLTVPATSTAIGKAQLACASPRTLEVALREPMNVLTRNTARTPGELLAKLAEARRSGYATDREEYRPGVSCVAAPVLVNGQAVAAFSVSSSNNAGHTAHCVRHVLAAASRLGAQLQLAGGMAC